MLEGSESNKRRHKGLRGSHDVLDLTDDHKSVEAPIDLTQSDGEDEDEEEEDEDLKLAIALSLQDQNESAPAPQSAPSLSSSSMEIQNLSAPTPQLDQHQSHIPSTGISSLGLSGLDRKQMEAERLARLKRKREMGDEPRQISPPPLRHLALPQRSAAPSSVTPDEARPDLSLQYPSGTILLTSVNKDQRQSASLTDLLRPTDSRAPLKSAFLSSYMFDFDWLLPHFDTRKVSFVLILHAQDKNHKTQLSEDFAGIPNVRLVFPHVGGNVNCMHSKIAILFYEQSFETQRPGRVLARCRIIIPSANLVSWDYGIGNVMENTLFVIDLPLKGKHTSPHDQDDIGFKNNLVQFLQAMNTPTDVTKRLNTFDFSATNTYGFVHTIGGSHMLSDTSDRSTVGLSETDVHQGSQTTNSYMSSRHITRTGMLSMSDTIRSLGLDASSDDGSYPPRLDYVVSSIGNLKESFLGNLFLAACGSTEELLHKYSKNAVPKRSKSPHNALIDAKVDTAELAQRVRIYFPSDDTVQKSRGGPEAAGTLFFQPKWSNNSRNEFFKESLQDCVGVRNDGVLMHSKILFLRFAVAKTLHGSGEPHAERQQKQQLSHKSNQSNLGSASDPPPTLKKYAGWVYIGSANLSESAWGSLVTDSKTKQPKLSCRNWESGVIIPVPLKPEHEEKNLHDLTLEEVFGDVMPVPIQYPGVNLFESGRKPWASSC